MNRPQIIDTSKTPKTSSKDLQLEKQSEVAESLVMIVSDLKSIFLEMQNKCDMIGSYLAEIEKEQAPRAVPLLQLITNDPSNRMSLIDLLTKGSSLARDTSNLRPAEEIPIQQYKKVKILKKFIDLKSREGKNPEKSSKKRNTIRPAYFRLKLFRIYAKALKYTIRALNSGGNNSNVASNIDVSNDDLFYENTIKYKKELGDVKVNINESKVNNNWYRKLFKESAVKTRNFKIFLEEFFESDIDRLIERFQFKCCQDLDHDDDCRQMWRELRDWSFSNFTGKKVRD